MNFYFKLFVLIFNFSTLLFILTSLNIKTDKSDLEQFTFEQGHAVQIDYIWKTKKTTIRNIKSISNKTNFSGRFVSGSPVSWNDTPSFSIISRLYSGSVMEYYNIFSISYLLFWPIEKWKNSDLILVFDDENEQDHRMGTILANLPPYPYVYFEKRPGQQTFCSDFKREGYSRQQYSNFYSDMYTNAEYIGIVDGDSYFVTHVMPEDLIINGKPRINGYNGCCKSLTESLEEAIGGEKVGEFMIDRGFPIIIKSKHFRAIREHIIQRMKSTSFEEAFYKICSKYNSNRYSQFDLMIHYLWNFKREEYSWHISDYEQTNHPEFSQRMTDKIEVLKANVPIASLAKHGVHLKWPTPTLDLAYDYLCVASDLRAGDCERYTTKEIIKETQMSLLVDWTFRTSGWKQKKKPDFVRRKMYENLWETEDLKWYDTYKIHLRNIKKRNFTKRWIKF